MPRVCCIREEAQILGLSREDGLASPESGKGNLQAGTRGDTNETALWFTANHEAATGSTAAKYERRAMSRAPKNGGCE